MALLQLQHVTRRFDNGQEGLSDVSLSIESGSMVFLTGHSGAGKSTLLKMLIGAEAPTTGRVLVDGSDVSQLGPRQMPWYRRQVGIVLQDHNLLEDRTVFDNVALPLRITHLPTKDIARRVRGALSTVDLSDKGGLFPRHLSTGEQAACRHCSSRGESTTHYFGGRTDRQLGSLPVASGHVVVSPVQRFRVYGACGQPRY
jgi:cell division transport system ATP-binding protein